MLKWQNGNDTVVVDDDDDDGRVDIDGRKKRAATTATMAAENASPPAAITLHLHVGCFLLGISSIPRGLPGDQSPQQGKRRTGEGRALVRLTWCTRQLSPADAGSSKDTFKLVGLLSHSYQVSGWEKMPIMY